MDIAVEEEVITYETREEVERFCRDYQLAKAHPRHYIKCRDMVLSLIGEARRHPEQREKAKRIIARLGPEARDWLVLAQALTKGE